MMSNQFVFQRYPDCNTIFFLYCLATEPEFRCRGIATECVRQSLKVAKKIGADLAILKATSPFSSKIPRNLGFKKIVDIKWKEQHIDGEIYFNNVECELCEGFIKILKT